MTHPRWTDAAFAPFDVSTPISYSGDVVGEVRRAALHDMDGLLLGHVWTDDQAAAGFLDADGVGPPAVRASTYVWQVHKRLFDAGRPASDVMDPALYAPLYRLAAPE
ncbi:hypothetical protein GCM10009555_017570 [Acrocarpospora macrocephala]|uniref:Uncharacterized protein n=1 Tax=Acrocarpospora macrocephala TaxID=150177 RepID=A0A5M3WEC6_9ACTN|nr:hypothetical protein [Acrocarpospora macrocephala]GES07417.1 hypothetical protein Amac_010120 [Acrocarpospora macrocephala]